MGVLKFTQILGQPCEFYPQGAFSTGVPGMWYSSAEHGAPKQTIPVMSIQNSQPSSPCLKMYSRSPVSGSTLETLGAHGGFYTSQHAAGRWLPLV